MRCRLCGEKDLSLVIDLGNVPLANNFLDSPNSPEELFPLKMVFCPKCSLCQLTEVVPAEKLFRQYNYYSSVSAGMVQHAKGLVDSLVKERHLDSNSQVIEIASNDAYLLQHFLPYGVKVLGIDPAFNMAQIAIKKGVPTLTEFFDDKMAEKLPKADVVIALNVLGHVQDPVAFMVGVNKVLKPNGIAVFEMPSIRETVDLVQPDQVYHEHLSYWGLASLKNLCKWGMLTIARVERIPIHGGSYRLYVTHNPVEYDRETNRMFEIEAALGVDRMEYYRLFSNRVRDSIGLLRQLLLGFKEQGKKIIAYGAAAKGTQLLNYLDVGAETIDYVVDSTPAKIGRYMPGSHVPVVSPDDIGEFDYCLHTARNWKYEIERKHPGFSGRWITPLPYPTIE